MQSITKDYFQREFGGVPGTTGEALSILAKFAGYNGKERGHPVASNPWNLPIVSGGLPGGNWAHVFTNEPQ